MTLARDTVDPSGSDSDTLGSLSLDDSTTNGKSKDDTDRDMTEDEVALMVKNALRKARRAMHSSSPFSLGEKSLHSTGSSVHLSESKSTLGEVTPASTTDYEKNSGDGAGGGLHKSISQSISLESDGGDLSNLVDGSSEDDLARRIEEEIHSARAFAEKVYYGGKHEVGNSSPKKGAVGSNTAMSDSLSDTRSESIGSHIENTGKISLNSSSRMSMSSEKISVSSGKLSLHSADTEMASNKAKKKGAATAPLASSTRNKTKDSVPSPGSRPPMAPTTPTSPSKAKDEGKGSAVPNSLGLENYDDDDIDENNSNVNIISHMKNNSPHKTGKLSSGVSGPAPPRPQDEQQYSSRRQKDGQYSPRRQSKGSNGFSSPSSPMSADSRQHSKTPQSPDSTSGEPLSPNAMSVTSAGSDSAMRKKRENRQVVFRHPYPLPPPPMLPRADDIIIAENSAREKEFQAKWVEPTSDLLQLIQAAEDDSLVRRSNACGAIKVLASKDSNQARLCRTRGLLDALVIASEDDAIDSDALDARTRAVTSLFYLSEPKDNRILVCKHPGVLKVLVKVIEEDTGEARLRACCALATLAKTPQNRAAIAKIETLATVLSLLMVENAVPKKEPQVKIKEAKGEDGEGIERMNTAESRDDSTLRDEASVESYATDDERMLTNTFSGTFSGTGTFTEDDHTFDDNSGSGSDIGSFAEEDDASSAGYSIPDDGSIKEEEGVEMQISSLKKLNIENRSDFLVRSQLSACATLTHLTKCCANAPLLSQSSQLLENIIFLSTLFDNPLHTKCIEMICNFTRFPSNNARLASMPKVVETLLTCGKSKIAEDRMWAIRSIQNLCSDASSKVTLATGPLLSLLSTAAMRKDYDEQFAAVGALMNLSTEPGSIVPLTNTKTVVATLVHLAHSPNTPAAVRKIACDSLATIGLWLQTLASAGTVPEEIPFSPLPTHSATGWLRWDS